MVQLPKPQTNTDKLQAADKALCTLLPAVSVENVIFSPPSKFDNAPPGSADCVSFQSLMLATVTKAEWVLAKGQ